MRHGWKPNPEIDFRLRLSNGEHLNQTLMEMTQTNSQPALSSVWYRVAIRGKTRILMAWAFSFLLGFSAREWPLWEGMAVCGVGAALRYWASGYLRKDQRPAVGGPYAYVRNPLYVGTYLMAVGTGIAVGNLWLLAALSVVFALVYHFIILEEEEKLVHLFGESFKLYMKAVPRFVPRVTLPDDATRLAINPERAHWSYSHALAWKNKAYEAPASWLGLVGLMYLIAYSWKSIS